MSHNRFKSNTNIHILNQLIATLLFAWMCAPQEVKASPNVSAPIGGDFNYNIIYGEPSNITPIPQSAVNSIEVLRWGCSHLFEQDLSSAEWKPAIAKNWSFSKDQKILTVNIRKDAYFHNGDPITAEDVRFSIEHLKTLGTRVEFIQWALKEIDQVKVTGPRTLKVYFHQPYFGNLNTFAHHIFIVPKKIYQKKEEVDKKDSFVCSGPYRFESWEKGQKITLKRFDKWFGFKDPNWKGYYNFDRIHLTFWSETAQISQAAKNLLIDFAELNWSTYANANIDAGMKSPYLKIHVQTELPRMLVFVGMNFENEILKSKNVRRAMALLMDRKSFNEKYFFNLYNLAVGPFMRTSPYFVPDLKPTPFDPSAARLLLQGDQWERNPQTGILEKTINGKKVPLELKLAFGNKFYAPLWDQYQQELRRVGIKLNIEKIDSPRLWELLTERKVTENKIDMWAMAWSETTLEGDPIQVWHSDSARKGGVNFGHYKNELVDQLIDKARREPNSKKRIELFKKASTLIAEDQPYVFMYNNKYVFYAHSKRIRKPQNSFRYGIGTETWWSSDIQNTKASK